MHAYFLKKTLIQKPTQNSAKSFQDERKPRLNQMQQNLTFDTWYMLYMSKESPDE